MEISIDDRLYNDIKKYCDLNEYNFQEKINHYITESYNREKYGDNPFKETIKAEVKSISSNKVLPNKELKVEKEVSNEISSETNKRRKIRIIKK